MESVLGVHEYRRGFDRSIPGCVCPRDTTMLYSPSITQIARGNTVLELQDEGGSKSLDMVIFALR